MAIVIWLPFTRPWWWVFAPCFLALEVKKLYIWWIQWDFNYANRKWVVLEMIPPKESLAPIKAMEDVFTVLWPTLLSPPSWREAWFEGIMPYQPEWMSFEIASIEGQLHFFARVTDSHRGVLESSLYAHYPDLEVHEVPDYTKDVPQNIPNQEWDVYGEDFILGKGKQPALPIKTYEKFFEPQGEKIQTEEKRMDPLASLLEAMSKLGSGEQFWVQFIIMTVTEEDTPELRKSADDIIAKISRRPKKVKVTLMDEVFHSLGEVIMGPHKEGKGEKATYEWKDLARSEEGENEMILTPGEREILTEVENKIKKPAFRVNLRGLYVASREKFKSSHKTLTRSYFSHFHTEHMNYIRFTTTTRPKTQYVFRKRIPFLRARRQFRNYIQRFTPLFPNRTKECLLLNTEEMATIFHFPLKVGGLAIPTLQRVESKKGGPPSNLPTE